MKEALRGVSCGAFVTQDGLPIYLNPGNPADIGTLGPAALNAHAFFAPQANDIVILNDPYSGGTHLQTLTFVTGWRDLLLAIRLPGNPSLRRALSIHEEGVRIPPTPLVLGGEVNATVMDGIAKHPLCYKEFKEQVSEGIATVKKLVDFANSTADVLNLDFSQRSLREIIKATHREWVHLIGEFSVGEATEENHKVRVRVETHPEQITFDFTGTASAGPFFVTDRTTLGVCIGALRKVVNAPLPTNAGVFDCVNLQTPAGSMVNAKFPSPVGLGFSVGTQQLEQLILQALVKIDPRLTPREKVTVPFCYELTFANGQRFHPVPSVERMEEIYPIRFKSLSSEDSASFETLEFSELASVGESSAIQVLRGDQRMALKDSGRLALEPKDVITLPWDSNSSIIPKAP